MADVKIKIKIDDDGALGVLRRFNETFKQLNNTSKQLSKNLNKTFKNVKREAGGVAQGIKRIQTSSKAAARSAKGLKKELGKLSTAGKTIKNVFAGVFIADALRAGINLVKNGISAAISEFVDFEFGLVGVAKTANLTAIEMEALGNKLLNMDVPTSNQRLLELAKTAGQLGVTGVRDIAKFTEVMAKLETATNVAGEEGATAIARILNITGTATQEVDRFGASLVQLGNTSAATESEILVVAERVASATSVFNVSAPDTLAFAAALKSLGQRAESGGSSIGRLFKQMDKAIAIGGPLLSNFSKIMNTTGESFTKAFRSDKTKVVLEFLNKLNKEGENTTAMLNKLGLGDIRVSATLGTLSKRVDVLNTAFENSRKAYKDNIALNEEYNRTLGTTKVKNQQFMKDLSKLAIELVNELAPAMKETLRLTRAFVNLFTSNKEVGIEVFIAGSSLGEIEKKREAVENLLAAKIKERELTEGHSSLARKLDLEIEKLEHKKKLLKEASDLAIEKGADALVSGITGDDKGSSETEAKSQTNNTLIELEKEYQKELKDINVLSFGEKIELVKKQDGTFAAMRLASQVKQLETEGKHEAGLKLINNRAFNAKKKLDKKASEQLIKDKKATMNAFTTLAKSESKELAAIGKVAAITQIAMDTPVAISGAYTHGTSIGGPPLGVLFGLAAASHQAQQMSAISRYENGGIVPGSSFSGDNVQARVNSGEMILNRQQQSNLFNMAKSGGSSNGQPIIVNTSVELDGEVVARSVSRKVANGMVLGENI